VDLQELSMRIDLLSRFLLGVAVGACIWGLGNKARAQSQIPATPNTETQAAAQDVFTPAPRYYVFQYHAPSPGFESRQAACSDRVAALGANAECPTVLEDGGGTFRCYYHWKPSGGAACDLTGGGSVISQSPVSCPSGYTSPDGVQCRSTAAVCPAGWSGPTNGQCSRTTYSCPSGYTLNGTMCDVNLLPAGQSCGNIAIPAAASPGAGGCVNGTLCYFDSASNQHAVAGSQVWYGPARSSGEACSGQPNAAGTPDTQCPPGKVPGTINGVTHCFTATDDKPAVSVETTTQTTTDAQGQTSQGATTTTTTDRGTAGTTTQTTTRNPDGSSTQSTQNGGPQDNRPDMQRFCEENPNASVCKNSSWGGACGAFACDGDAVQCAIAMEQHRRNCSLFDAPTSLSTLGNQVSSGADPQASQNPALEANRQTIGLSGSLSQESFLTPGGLTDQQITVTPWLTVSLPWSQLNYYLSLMGAIVVAFALVFAARIVIGAR
jgi:hypothetical protein